MAQKKTVTEAPQVDPYDGLDQEDLESYVPKETEKHVYHVELEKVKFHPTTGERLSKAYMQKLSKKAYVNFAKHSAALGFTSVKVLWDPTQDNF